MTICEGDSFVYHLPEVGTFVVGSQLSCVNQHVCWETQPPIGCVFACEVDILYDRWREMMAGHSG